MKKFKDFSEYEKIQHLFEEIESLSYIIEDEGYSIRVYASGGIHPLLKTIYININKTMTAMSGEMLEILEEYMDRIQELVENTLVSVVNPPDIDITLGKLPTGYPDFRICLKDSKAVIIDLRGWID